MLMKLRTIQLSASPLSWPRMKTGISAGTSVIASIATPIMANLLVKASGWNSLALLPAEGEDRQKTISMMISTEKKIGRPTSRQARDDDLGRVAVDLSWPKCCVQFVRGVLHHDHRRIHQNADADGDPRQRHDVAGRCPGRYIEQEAKSAPPAAA